MFIEKDKKICSNCGAEFLETWIDAFGKGADCFNCGFTPRDEFELLLKDFKKQRPGGDYAKQK